MVISDMIRELCERKNISIAELCRRIGQTPQNFNKKLQRDTVSFEEMIIIAEALEVGYEQVFILPAGEKVGIRNIQFDSMRQDEGDIWRKIKVK